MKFVIMFLFMFPMMAFAQDAPIPTDQFLMFILQSIGGIKGASALAIVGISVQIVIKFLSSDLCNQVFKGFSGFAKLITVSSLTLISGVLSLMISSGMGLGAALLHSSTLAAFMVLIDQIIKQFKNK